MPPLCLSGDNFQSAASSAAPRGSARPRPRSVPCSPLTRTQLSRGRPQRMPPDKARRAAPGRSARPAPPRLRSRCPAGCEAPSPPPRSRRKVAAPRLPSPWLEAPCPPAVGRAVSRGRKRPNLQSSPRASQHPMAGARRAPRVLLQAGGKRRGATPARLPRPRRGPGRAALLALPPGAARAGAGASTGGVPGHGGGRRESGKAARGAGAPCRTAARGGGADERESFGNFGLSPAPGRPFSPAEAPPAAPAASSAVRASSPAGRSAEGLQYPIAEVLPRRRAARLQARRGSGAGRLLTLPEASTKLAGRHPRRRRLSLRSASPSQQRRL